MEARGEAAAAVHYGALLGQLLQDAPPSKSKKNTTDLFSTS